MPSLLLARFELAPVAYLVTDRVGVIREVNRRAAGLLGVAQDFLAGRPLSMFVTADDRWELRNRLGRLGGLEPGAWQLRLQPRRREPVPVVVSTSVAQNHAGEVTGLRWQLLELPATQAATDAPAPTASSAGSPALLAELVASRPTGPPALTAVPSAAPDWDKLAQALHRVVGPRCRCCRPMGPG